MMLGEWSVGLPPPGTELNPVITDEDFKKFGEAQLDIYGRLAKAGWTFWTYKVEDEVNSAWNFRESRARGWLPFEEIDQWGGTQEVVWNGDGGRNPEVL